MSFRTGINGGMTPAIEFVVPLRVQQDAAEILYVMNHNEAPHAHEHMLGSAVSVPVNMQERANASKFIEQKTPGSFFYAPILHACAMEAHKGTLFSPRMAEVSNSRFYPMTIFANPIPTISLSDHPINQSDENYDYVLNKPK